MLFFRVRCMGVCLRSSKCKYVQSEIQILGLKILENFSHILCCTPQKTTGVILHAYLTITMTFPPSPRWPLQKGSTVFHLYSVYFIWIFQLPFESSRSKQNHESQEHIKNCVISLSEHNFNMVVAELAYFIKEPPFLVSKYLSLK